MRRSPIMVLLNDEEKSKIKKAANGLAMSAYLRAAGLEKAARKEGKK